MRWSVVSLLFIFPVCMRYHVMHDHRLACYPSPRMLFEVQFLVRGRVSTEPNLGEDKEGTPPEAPSPALSHKSYQIKYQIYFTL